MSFTLLTIPGVSLSTSTISESGILALEHTSGDEGATNPEGAARVTLALHVNSHFFNLTPHSPVTLVILPSGERIYTFEAATGEKSTEKPNSVRITVPPPTEDAQHVAADIETFDQVLTQYADFSWTQGSSEVVPPPLPARRGQAESAAPPNIKPNVEEHKPVQDPSLRGRLLLMDETNGDVVGELPETLNITEDPSMPGTAGSGADAVVLEMHPDMFDACTGVRPLGSEGEELLGTREVFVSVVPPEEQDWMMKGASIVSQAISSSTSVLLSGITTASNYYITHSTPGTPASGSGANSPAVQTSPSVTNSTLAKAHALSGQARAATAKTADVVGGMIRYAVGGAPKPSSSSTTPSRAYTSPPPRSPIPQGPPPSYAVYTPKQHPVQNGLDKPLDAADSTHAEEQFTSDPGPRKPVRTLDRVIMSANLVLTTVDDSARRVFEVGSDRLGAVVGHKYGRDAQHSTHLATHAARNVVLIYVDVRGFARRALITKAGKEFVKGRVSSHREKTRGDASPAPAPAPAPAFAVAPQKT